METSNSLEQLRDEVRLQCVVEYLAKADGKTHEFFHSYGDTAMSFCRGEKSSIRPDIVASLKIQGLMLEDNEERVIELKPELAEVYHRADRNQLRATRGLKNLDYYKEHGIDFSVVKMPDNVEKTNYAQPLTVTYLHNKIITSGGFDGTGPNYIYHDVIDHLWLLDAIAKGGLGDKYSKYFSEIGNPLKGSLLSREAELISGIGYNTRRFYTDPQYFGTMGLSEESLINFLATSAKPSVAELSVELERNLRALNLAKFVVSGTIANLVTQRERMGAVKKLVVLDNGSYEISSEVSSLFDDSYIGLICDSVLMIEANKDDFMQKQKNLNYLVELALRKAFGGGAHHTIKLSDMAESSASKLPASVVSELDEIPGFSTKHI